MAITDLIGGQLQVMFTVGPAGLPQIKARKLRGLAVSTAKRSAFAPDLPTVAESGLPGYDVFGWNGVLVTAGTPRPVIEKLHTLFITATKDPEVRTRMAGFGFEPIGNTPRNSAPSSRKTSPAGRSSSRKPARKSSTRLSARLSSPRSVVPA